MSTVRLYHLASEWDIDSLEMMEKLSSSRYDSHLMAISTDEVAKVRAILEGAGMFHSLEPEAPESESTAVDDESVDEAPTETEAVFADGEGTDSDQSDDVSEDADIDSQAPETDVATATEVASTKTPVEASQASSQVKDRGTKDTRKRDDRKKTPSEATKRKDRRSRPERETADRGNKAKTPSPATKDARKGSRTTTSDTRAKSTRRNRGKGSNSSSSTGQRDDYNPFSFEETLSATKDKAGGGVVIRRTIPGAMQHGSNRNNSSRRRMQHRREKDKWSGRNSRGGRGSRGYRPAPKVRPSEVSIRLPISVKELSAATGIKLNDLIGKLMGHGYMLNQAAAVPEEALTHVSHDFLIDIQVRKDVDLEEEIEQVEKQVEEVSDNDLETRRPVVTIMGHVDHGKTTLLDYIRNAKSPVAGSEAGGITQHIGAYVAYHNNKPITFIDTPGHAAFTQMRSRGAKITDIVVLVVAADDSLKAQTMEAIAHAQAAGVEMIVAINKIDKDNADVEAVYQDLASNNLQPVKWGGKIECIETSAITGHGVDDLLETILTVAELHEYKANPKGDAFGYVLEARKTQGRGVVASVLVSNGTLSKGDWIITGAATGRVRRMFADNGKVVKKAGPGVPVEVLGLSEVPLPGDKFHVFDQKNAKDLSAQRDIAKQKEELSRFETPTLDNVFESMEEDKLKRLPLILRADVQGSVEVLKNQIPTLSNDEVVVEIKQALVGSVTENDIFLAHTANGMVIAFNVPVDSKAASLAKEKEVEISNFKVIYEVLDFLHQRVEDALDPEEKENTLGELLVRKTFKASRIGVVAGCYVDSGIVRRNARGRVMRETDGVRIVIWEGEIESVKRFQEDVKEVREGFECGVKLKNYNDVKEGDLIEVFEILKIKRVLSRT